MINDSLRGTKAICVNVTYLKVEGEHVFAPPRLALAHQVAAVRGRAARQHARRRRRARQRAVEPRPLRQRQLSRRLARLFCY